MLFWVAILFFSLGCLYAFLNRILKFPTSWKLTMVHFNTTLFTVIFILLKIFSDTSVVQMNSIYIFNSMLFLSFVFALSQLLFVVNAGIGMIRRMVY